MFVSQRLEETMATHGPVYGQTLEVGRRLCASTTTSTEPADHGQLFQELRCLEEAWEQTSTLLGRRTALVNTVLQVHTARTCTCILHTDLYRPRTPTSPSL